MSEKVKFVDLSWPLKLGIVGGCVALAVYSIAFLVGVIVGVMRVG